jgi:lysophospholipase L1-like esterase
MISGFPLAAEAGFLHQAVQHLHQAGQFKVAFEVVAMGGFPAHRARKHLAKRVLAHRPDFVVIQFGSTDASAPLRNGIGLRHFLKKQPHLRETVSARPPAPLDLLKWKLRNVASECLLIPPLAPLDNYLATLLNMAYECRLAGSIVVVISPFVMGGGRSNRFARDYTRALERQLPRTPGIHFLDAHTLLSQSPRKQMLLSDGFHLSAPAHRKLGLALGELLKEAAGQKLAAASAGSAA